MNSLVTRTVTQNMSDALVSFAYNVGAGTLAASDLLAHVNAGSFSAAAGQFDLYILTSGGIVSAGLDNCRAAERHFSLTGPVGQGNGGPCQPCD